MKNLIEIYDTINHIGEKLVFIGTQIKNKPTKAQYNLLIHILENEKDNMIREGVVHLFENSFQTFELLNEIYIKTDKDELIRTYIQLKIQEISRTTHLSEKQRLLINSFLNTEYHFHIPPTCEKINVAQFTSSFNKRLDGDVNPLWVDVDDKICVWLGNFVHDNNLVLILLKRKMMQMKLLQKYKKSILKFFPSKIFHLLNSKNVNRNLSNL